MLDQLSYIYIHNESIQNIRNSFLQFFSLVLFSRYKSLGLRIEESLREIPISTAGAKGGVFFETRISRAREISPPAQGGASDAYKPRHQV